METIYYNYNNEKRELKNVPLENIGGNEYVSYSELLKAEQRRIVEKNKLSISKLFDLLVLHTPVHSKTEGIKQKFRFNKILFYIKMKLNEEFGENTFEFEEMGKGRTGPIPIQLKEDLYALRDEGFIKLYIEKDGKKIPESDNNYGELMRTRAGSGVAELTTNGIKKAEALWIDMDESFGNEFLDIIQKMKQNIIYMDTEALKTKVHSEYPEWRMYYSENDTENYF